MKLTVLGATGGTGRSLIEQALAARHEIVAVARRPDAFNLSHERLHVVRGDVYDQGSLVPAVEGADAVLSCVGLSGLLQARRGTDLYSVGTRHLLGAMAQARTRRIVLVSSGGVEPQPSDSWFYREVLKRFFLQKMYEDMKTMEATVKASSLDWTIVRPPYLTSGPLRTSYRFQADGPFTEDRNLSRHSLAHFLLQEAERHELSRRIVWIIE